MSWLAIPEISRFRRPNTFVSGTALVVASDFRDINRTLARSGCSPHWSLNSSKFRHAFAIERGGLIVRRLSTKLARVIVERGVNWLSKGSAMGTGIDPKVDIVFKRIYGNEEYPEVLKNLLNAVLAGSGVRRIVDVQILNPFSHLESLDDRMTILDIRARDDQGRVYIIEMQLLLHKAFRERLLYYLAKEYSQMLGQAENFTELRPVIVVCIIDAVLFPVTAETPETAGYHSRYELRDPDAGVRFSDHWTVHVIELPKFTKPLTGLVEDIDRWAYFLKHGAELDPDNLPASLQTPTIQIAAGVLDKMSHNTAEREQYEARLKFQRDQSCYLADAREEGETIGRVSQTRMLILRIGTKRLGEPPTDVHSELNAISSLDRLNELADRILDCSTWDALLGNRSD